MKKTIEIIESDPYTQGAAGFYIWNGQVTYRDNGGCVCYLNGVESVLRESSSPENIGGSMIDGEQLIRIMKISAHINSPSKVEKI